MGRLITDRCSLLSFFEQCLGLQETGRVGRRNSPLVLDLGQESNLGPCLEGAGQLYESEQSKNENIAWLIFSLLIFLRHH